MSDSNCASCSQGTRAPITPHSQENDHAGNRTLTFRETIWCASRYATRPYGFRRESNPHQLLTRQPHYQLCYRSIWSRKRDSNPHDLLGRQACYPLNIIPTSVWLFLLSVQSSKPHRHSRVLRYAITCLFRYYSGIWASNETRTRVLSLATTYFTY